MVSIMINTMNIFIDTGDNRLIRKNITRIFKTFFTPVYNLIYFEFSNGIHVLTPGSAFADVVAESALGMADLSGVGLAAHLLRERIDELLFLANFVANPVQFNCG